MKVDVQQNVDKPKIPLPTLSQINADRITLLANQYWSPQTKENHLPYDAAIVESIYQAEILGSSFAVRRIMMLEFSQYLENYLWPHYETGKASHAHMMSIIVMINEKFRERVPAWQAFLKKPEHFPAFFEQVLRASVMEEAKNMREQTALLLFLNHCFGSMEVQLCRHQVKRLVSLSMWISLQEGRRNQEFKAVPKWRKYWRAIQKKDKPELMDKLIWERRYLQRLMIKFMRILESIPETDDVDPHAVRYCERFLELMIDLEALLPTRRFFNTVMDDCHLVVRCQLAPLARRPEGQLFVQVSTLFLTESSKRRSYILCILVVCYSLTPDIKNPRYCLGQMYRNSSDPSQGLVPVAVTCFEKIKTSEIETGGVLTLVSVVFLIATFAIYMYLPQLRDLQGVCYMCMCVSMAFGFLSLGILQLSPGFRGQICAITGFLVYFWMIATFSWMNVISINMYRTVQDASYLKKTERKQHLLYNCYAWGFAIFFLVVALSTDLIEGGHYKPGIGDTSCWFSGRTETWIFFYGPIAALITANVILFVLSSLKLWKSTRKYEVNKLNNLKHKFLTSLKLFLVMGISWIFEIASFAHGESHIIWRIMDIFNCLQGLVIFLILVVFRKRVIQGLASDNCCLFITRPWAEKLSPDDDCDDQEILADDTVEVRLN